MQQHNTPHTRYFLNRLAISVQEDPETTNPLVALRSIFEYAQAPEEIMESLNLVCKAAMHNEYTWQQGSPGNCLYYSARLELLIECCYLLSLKTPKKIPTDKKNPLPKKLPLKLLPAPLTASEFRDPMQVIKSFFVCTPLQEWKRQLYLWTENALSNSSVKDELEPETLLPFTEQLPKLIYAAYLLYRYIYPEKEV